MSQLEIEDEVATDLQRATGTADAGAGDSTRLNRVLQLTGALMESGSELEVEVRVGVRPHVALRKGQRSSAIRPSSHCSSAAHAPNACV